MSGTSTEMQWVKRSHWVRRPELESADQVRETEIYTICTQVMQSAQSAQIQGLDPVPV